MPDRPRICLLVLTLHLTGCADVNWQRAFYDGVRNTRNAEPRCRSEPTPAATTCARLPDHDQYDKERAAVKNPSGAKP